jgi:hypothetical protein
MPPASSQRRRHSASRCRIPSAIDAKIDELYTLPLTEFTAARNALAKTLKGDDAAQVKRLEKPAVVPWTVNQLYWRERRTWDRLMASGRALRAAQIAALKGKSADLRAATADHRTALSDALATATQLAAQSGSKPAAEPLARMLEAVSLAQELPTRPGRSTDLLQPAGFEALAGVTPLARPAATAAPPSEGGTRAPAAPHAKGSAPKSSAAAKHDAAAERRRAEAAAAARKAADAAARQARHVLDQARALEARVKAQADTARQALERAESALADARQQVERATAEAARAEDALKAL